MRAGRPFVLVVCDGWGHSEDTFGNAIAAARTPEFDRLMSIHPSTLVAASGEAVGLPPGKSGNSEVGHLTMGSGRVVHQSLTAINHAIAGGSFFENPVLCEAIDRAVRHGQALHCMGLVSDNGVHSSIDHAIALAALAARRGLERLCFHAFTDGRDSPPTSGADHLRRLIEQLERVGTGRIVSISGRYWAMDRDRRWDRTERAYAVIAGGGAGTQADPIDYVTSQYAAGVTDEFIEPVSVVGPGGERCPIGEGDSVVFFNFRPDRARQLIHALTDERFDKFERCHRPTDLHVVTFTEYQAGLPVHVAFLKPIVSPTLGDVVSLHGLRQFHVAETEKYAHVTYFINGGREQAFDGEERLLVPSPRVATYDQTPAMSAVPVTDAVVSRLADREDALIVVNFANPDMLGHTGVFSATVEAVEVVDACLGRIARAVEAAGGAMLITADHGNAEHKIDPADNSPLTAHTASPVPVLLCGGGDTRLRDGGGLRDIAPTVLEVMGLRVPAEMTGRSLAG